ncbi:3-oxoacyl-[acyl-carrier protein] reductase [Antricoccus suffuscus]|uniref:3-oxoacyl-[acyl-carrier protein] reductase n=1 Tax=Antricoccus suffuscus TaxID=1629062 RepID=A0A2T1A6X1_9ACTN|nr:SDR family oxidoreductase [Antricoccus suffuscus]PRZ44349.1 3-oxoacyl-[acyl-carrier protein] reductase [Antricoccus suffuscus]
MDLQLAGKTVFVSGSGQGLGRAIGEAFAAEGAKVAFHYNSSGAGAEEAVAGIKAAGGQAVAVGADIRDDAAVQKAVDTAESELGPIDVLVNNSAVTGTGKFVDTTPEEWARQADVTIMGTLRMTQAVVKKMIANGGGSIVSLMGDSGRVGESGLLVTATTRSTTVGLTKSLAKELARHQIRANAVSIALVRTDNFDQHVGSKEDERMKKILSMYPLRRLGKPDDVTPTILLLASPLSSWTTGQVLSVNGGYSMQS